MSKALVCWGLLFFYGLKGLASQRCEESSIPDHSFEDLREIQKWALGSAFSSFSKEAGVVFDTKRYLEDNPSPFLFAIGFHSGRACLAIDVVTLYASMSVVLSRYSYKYADQPSLFRKKYLELIEESGFSEYLVSEDAQGELLPLELGLLI